MINNKIWREKFQVFSGKTCRVGFVHEAGVLRQCPDVEFLSESLCVQFGEMELTQSFTGHYFCTCIYFYK